MKNKYIIKRNNQEFNTNPDNLNSNMVFKGRIGYGIFPEEYCDVYGISEEEVIALGKEFKKIEPNAQRIYIWGPCDWMSLDEDDRTFVTAAFL